jgi:hypothetical protein
LLLALNATLLVLVALLAVLYLPVARERLARHRRRARRVRPVDYDPGRERRAERRARALLRSCLSEEDWEVYRDLGFVRVWGGRDGAGEPSYAYLIYPHKPIVAYLPGSGTLLNEYCVTFEDHSSPHGSRLPDADDVLAKWMALSGDEKALIAEANMHLPGRQLDPQLVRRDLRRLARHERERQGAHQRHLDNVHAA